MGDAGDSTQQDLAYARRLEERRETLARELQVVEEQISGVKRLTPSPVGSGWSGSKQDGELRAVAGTVQGNSGWYTQRQTGDLQTTLWTITGADWLLEHGNDELSVFAVRAQRRWRGARSRTRTKHLVEHHVVEKVPAD